MMIEIRIVKDNGQMIGIEFQKDADLYFISIRQDIWPGLRLGAFPCRSNGTDFERETVKVFYANE